MKTFKSLIERYTYYSPQKYTSIRSVEKRYYEDGDKTHDNFKTISGEYYAIMTDINEVDKYKEYTWSSKKFRRKDFDPEYWDGLVEDIRKNGIRSPIIIILYKHEPNKAHIGEGNHRLGVAKEIGLKELPVRFEFWMGDEKRKKKSKPDKEFDRMLKKVEKEKEEIRINDLLKQILGEI